MAKWSPETDDAAVIGPIILSGALFIECDLIDKALPTRYH